MSPKPPLVPLPAYWKDALLGGGILGALVGYFAHTWLKEKKMTDLEKAAVVFIVVICDALREKDEELTKVRESLRKATDAEIEAGKREAKAVERATAAERERDTLKLELEARDKAKKGRRTA